MHVKSKINVIKFNPPHMNNNMIFTESFGPKPTLYLYIIKLVADYF